MRSLRFFVAPLSVAVIACTNGTAATAIGAGDGGDGSASLMETGVLGRDTGARTKDGGASTKDGSGSKGNDGASARDGAHADAHAKDGSHTGADAVADVAVDAFVVMPDGGPCEPGSGCVVADESCLALIDNSTKTTFGLRMSQLAFIAPPTLAEGPIASAFGGGVTPDMMTCNLAGTGTFSWLLDFDTTAGTLETGGALPAANPMQGYAFVDMTITQGTTMFDVQPATYQAGLTNGAFSTTAGQSLFLPVYLDATGSSLFVLPLRELVLAGTLSSNHDCIGWYNASTLEPANDCQPVGSQQTFTQGGTGSAFITLADADTVILATLNESLCVLFSGDAVNYGMTASGGTETVCKRNAQNEILFPGDWCAATNSTGSGACADSIEVSFGYAASSVLITP